MEVNVIFNELKRHTEPNLRSFLSKIKMDSFGNETFLFPIMQEVLNADCNGGVIYSDKTILNTSFKNSNFTSDLLLERKPSSIEYTLEQKQKDNIKGSKKSCVRFRMTHVACRVDENGIILETNKKNKDTMKLGNSSRLVFFRSENSTQRFTKSGLEFEKRVIGTSGNVSFLAESDKNNTNIFNIITEFGDRKKVKKEEYFCRTSATEAIRTTFIYTANGLEVMESFADIDGSVKTFDEMTWKDKELSDNDMARLKKEKSGDMNESE